ncbi:hypothetical protein B0H63DRAFT_497164 [Podospora didyma]|uniref:Uncharacterized protein n=1 Tax=Podospora didyma TaxID=330526 RepID=A0AAE0K4G2_9PEZI|nr:hypothetical protein B0H63DRAFT_497164 [Podospora didyma]
MTAVSTSLPVPVSERTHTSLSAKRGREIKIAKDASIVARIIGFVLSNGITLPYYRFYRQNTLLPMLSIARSLKDREQPDVISRRLQHWREKKASEFQFIQVASTLLSAAVIGCFSWQPRETQHWLGPAAWYASLVLSLSALFLSSSFSFVFSTIKNSPTRPALSNEVAMVARLSRLVLYLQLLAVVPQGKMVASSIVPPPTQALRVAIRWKMVFTWQAPMMLMAYSVIGFLMGLLIYVCTPLYDGRDFDGESKVRLFYAILFLSWATVAGATFIFCSFWTYGFVSLDGDTGL